MHETHSLLQCPLHNLATMTIDTNTRTITSASTEMIQLLDDEDPIGTKWPSKQDQQLCFTTLVDLQSTRRQKRLLTCEHINTNNPSTTVIQCADISALEQFYYNSGTSFFNTFLINNPSSPSDDSTIILRMNPYGVIQAAFAPIQSSSLHTSLMIGQPLMRFIHNDDIPILCSGLRQVTRCQQDDDDDDDTHDDDDTEFTMMSFDLRCDLQSILGNHHTPFYHFTTVVTSTQDILCIMRPSTKTNTSTLNDIPSNISSVSSKSRSSSYSSVTTTPSISSFTTLPSSSSSRSRSSSTTTTTTMKNEKLSIYQLAQFLCKSGMKIKQLINGLQQALWYAVEQGLMLLAHYLAVVMVLALQYYRLARHPSFWLETSELALRCLVAETKSRPELDQLFGWLEWSGFGSSSRRLFGMALDHGSEWLISISLRS